MEKIIHKKKTSASINPNLEVQYGIKVNFVISEDVLRTRQQLRMELLDLQSLN